MSPIEPSLFPDGRNRLILGDCLPVASSLPPSTLSLVYLDPPFGTGRAQPYRFGLGRREPPMEDHGDPGAWCEQWRPRLQSCANLLRPGGILVLHLDPRLAPRARNLLEDLLGAANYLNEIVWHYRTGGVARDRFPGKHDTLLVWRNGTGHTFHPLTEKRYLAHRAARPGVEEQRDARGWYRYARIDDVWEIPFLPADSRERLGYPTQKPEALVERILLAFTNPGDPIADLTCGSGTAPAVAQRLGRAWIAADRDPRSVVCTAGRLARLLVAELDARWRSGSVEDRKADLSIRLDRWRNDPGQFGFTTEERDLLARAALDKARASFRIEADLGDSGSGNGVESEGGGEKNARTNYGRNS